MLAGFTLPMAPGSAAGAALGAALRPFAPTGFPKLLPSGAAAGRFTCPHPWAARPSCAPLWAMTGKPGAGGHQPP